MFSCQYTEFSKIVVFKDVIWRGVVCTSIPVLIMYHFRMLTAIESCKTIIQKATKYFLNSSSNFKLAETHYQDKLPDPVIASENEKSLVVFNPLPYPREEVICISVNSISISVASNDDKDILQQISPVFDLDSEKANVVGNVSEVW